MCYKGDDIVRSQSAGIKATQRLASITETMGRIRIRRAQGLISGGNVATAIKGEGGREKWREMPWLLPCPYFYFSASHS